MTTMGSKDYWQGYTDAKKQSERNWQRARMEVETKFINILEDAKEVKGVGPKTHQALIEFAMDQMFFNEEPASVEISKSESGRIRKELANTKWSSLSDDQLVKIQNILSLQ